MGIFFKFTRFHYFTVKLFLSNTSHMKPCFIKEINGTSFIEERKEAISVSTLNTLSVAASIRMLENTGKF